MHSRLREKHAQLESLCRRFGARRLAVFGSALSEDFDPGRSDLDFVVELDPPAAGSYARTFFGLAVIFLALL